MLLGDTECTLYSPEFEDNTFVPPDVISKNAETEVQFYHVCQGIDIIYFFKNYSV